MAILVVPCAAVLAGPLKEEPCCPSGADLAEVGEAAEEPEAASCDVDARASLCLEECCSLHETQELRRSPSGLLSGGEPNPENQLTERFEPFSLGGEGSCGDTQPSGPCSSLDFLSAADWGRARQAVRHLRGGASGVGRPVSCEMRLPGL